MTTNTPKPDVAASEREPNEARLSRLTPDGWRVLMNHAIGPAQDVDRAALFRLIEEAHTRMVQLERAKADFEEIAFVVAGWSS